jgi:Zn-dependent peptidase ImmA (M78 family)
VRWDGVATVRVEVNPEMLKWACDRAGVRGAALREQVPQLSDWIEGKQRPTLRQLENFADKARVAVGYLFLPTPPDERVPIPDLRTVGGQGVRRPSPDLLDVIHLCQRRQDWYREYAERVEAEPVAFVGSATQGAPAEEVADRMRRALELSVEDRQATKSLDDAMRLFIDKTEAAGVLVMTSGIVGPNTHRKLDPDEFRGFALSDPLAPLIFVNSVDGKAAQMFTLAHELAHLWLGTSALSDASLPRAATNAVEQWCNRVAAEFLVPLATIRGVELADPLPHLKDLSRRFKVSSLVILRRLLDAGAINGEQFRTAYTVISQAAKKPDPEAKGGGDFYNSFRRSASKRFIRTLYADTQEGNTLYRDALELLGISKLDTFRELASKVSD